VYPRLTALSEVAWSPKEKRNLEDFNSRMKTHFRRFEILGVKYGFNELDKYMKNSTVIGHWKAEQMQKEGDVLDWNLTPHIKAPGKYNIIFLYTHGSAAVQIAWAAIFQDQKEIHRDTHSGWSGGNKRDIVYKLKLEKLKPEATYFLKAHLTPHGDTNSNGEIRISREKQ